jgi:hypothetical protein
MKLYRWIRRALPFDCGGTHYGNHEWEPIEGTNDFRCKHCPNRLTEDKNPGFSDLW